MEKNLVIEMRVLAPEAETSDDTTGYIRKAGGDQQEYLAFRPVVLFPPVIIRGFNPQPDPSVTEPSGDVQGFMNMQEESTGEGSGGWTAGHMAAASGITTGALLLCALFLL